MNQNNTTCCCCHGPQGPQGVAGVQGQQGVQGVTGQNGSPGPMGPQGVQGAGGLVGPPGAQGLMGLQGLPGPQGPAGPVGPMGPQGTQGTSGVDGVMGPLGPQGAQGIPGPQGPQGLQGVPGSDCDCMCCDRYFNVYASVAQTIQAYNTAGDTVLFDSTNVVSASDFDLSMVNVTGDITFLKHGVYHLAWQLQGRVTPPIPNPVPSWSFGFWVNGVLVPGSIYSGYTQAPGDDACHSTGDVQFEMKVGDKLRLRNTSVSSVNLNPNITGSVFPITIASINVEGLKVL
jgi:hypothetical protein